MKLVVIFLCIATMWTANASLRRSKSRFGGELTTMGYEDGLSQESQETVTFGDKETSTFESTTFGPEETISTFGPEETFSTFGPEETFSTFGPETIKRRPIAKKLQRFKSAIPKTISDEEEITTPDSSKEQFHYKKSKYGDSYKPYSRKRQDEEKNKRYFQHSPDVPDVESEDSDSEDNSEDIGSKNFPPSSPSCMCSVQSAYKVIQGEHFNRTNKALKMKQCGRMVAGNLTHKAVLAYYNVDFGKQGAKSIVLSMATGSKMSQVTTSVQIHLDNPKGVVIAKFNIISFEKPCKFFEHRVLTDKIVTGIHSLYFNISAHALDSSIKAMEMDWFVFSTDVGQSCSSKHSK